MHRPARIAAVLLAVAAAALSTLSPAPLRAQELRGTTVAAPDVPSAALREPALPAETIKRSRQMLADMRAELEKNYYDSTFHGIDMRARYAAADSAITWAPSVNHAMAAIADYMMALNDSHTAFIPPSRVAEIDYGFDMKFYGDTCFVTRVNKTSDAKKMGLKRGDAILKIDNIVISRANFGMVNYVYNGLAPRPGMRLVVRSSDGQDRDFIIKSKITEGDRVIDLESQTGVARFLKQMDDADTIANHDVRSIGDSVLYWKLESFEAEDEANMDRIIGLARDRRALVLDLRGNGGGYSTALRHLVGRFYAEPIDMFTVVWRNGRTPIRSIAAGGKAYNGMLVILIDSESGSSSEITARALQLDGRAIIVGDRSAGAVVTARTYSHSVGFGRRVDYAAYVSVADVVMTDGNRLEGIGVVPDHLVLPTGADMAAGGDVQLAKALSLIGIETDKSGATAMLRSAKRFLVKSPGW